MDLRSAVRGKTGKTSVLPRFCRIESRDVQPTRHWYGGLLYRQIFFRSTYSCINKPTIWHVLPMFCACSFHGNSMNNLLSYCGLIDAKIRASDKDLPVQKNVRFLHWICLQVCKSFSEALIVASTNPQYDKRLFMKLPWKLQAQNMGRAWAKHVQPMFSACSFHGKSMNNLLSYWGVNWCKNKSFWQRFTCNLT